MKCICAQKFFMQGPLERPRRKWKYSCFMEEIRYGDRRWNELAQLVSNNGL